MTIVATSIDHVKTSWFMDINMRYTELPATGFEHLEDTITIEISILPPDNCNTLYNPIGWEYGNSQLSWTVDLCAFVNEPAKQYTSQAPAWCGELNYYFTVTQTPASPPVDLSVFTFANETTTPNQMIVTIYAMDPVYFAYTFDITLRPDYNYDPDETDIYHDGDSMTVTFVTSCDQYNIALASAGPSLYWLEVLNSTVVSLPGFTKDGETFCPLDCAQ